MGEKYLNAIDKPVPGLITHADSGLHIDHAPQFLQTPLWAASGLPPTNLVQAKCVKGDLRRTGGGLEVPPESTVVLQVLPLSPTTHSGFCLQEGYSWLVPLQPSPRCAGGGAGGGGCGGAQACTRRHTHSPAAAASSSRTRRVVTPGAAVSHHALREYKLIKCFPALSQGPQSPSQA